MYLCIVLTTHATKIIKFSDMEVCKRVNVAGSMRLLGVNDSFSLPRPEYKPSMIRAAASRISADTGWKFTVKMSEKSTTVTRIS